MFFSILCLAIPMNLSGQNLQDYQWENRLILIITNDPDSQNYIAQIEEFKPYSQEFKERSLISCHVLPEKYFIKNDNSESWIKDSQLSKKYNSDNKAFKVILIGLDGRIKIEQNHLLTAKKLFTTIEAMPMRRAELKNK